MSKIFLPPLDTFWRLTADYALREAMVDSYHNEELAKNLGAYINFGAWPTYANNPRGFGWTDALREEYAKYKAELRKNAHPLVFPAGTIFSMERYHVSRSGEDQITIMLKASPAPHLDPKKRGGKMKGKGRVYLWLEDFNAMPELEQVHDFV